VVQLSGVDFQRKCQWSAVISNMVAPELVKKWIEQGLSGSNAEVIGDGRHFEATVISSQFAGKSMLEQHRMVYSGLGDKMDETIHALSLKTYTPEQWEGKSS